MIYKNIWKSVIVKPAIVTLIIYAIENEMSLVLLLIVFVGTPLIDITRILIWIKPTAKRLQNNYSIELDGRFIIERYFNRKRELKLDEALLTIDQYGSINLNRKSQLKVLRWIGVNYISIPPEIDRYTDLKETLIENVCQHEPIHYGD